MKIIDVRVIVTCPVQQSFVFLKILTDEGVYGIGEGTKNGRELAVATLLKEHIAPMLIGRDPGAIEDIWKLLYKGAYWRGGPIEMAAISAVDMALWDIKGKIAGLPVYSLLGGPTRNGALTYYHASGNSPEDTAEKVIAAVEKGYRVVRCQATVEGQTGGYGVAVDDPKQEEAQQNRLPYEGIWEPYPYLRSVANIFKVVRQRAGWNVQLLHDAHGRLTPIEAAQLAKELEPFKLMFLEDPIGPEHASAMELVRAASTTPLAIGETISSADQILPMVINRLIDYMRCSPIHIGGITPAKKLAAIAEPFEVLTAFHGPGDIGPVGDAASVHIDLAIQNFGIQEWVDHPDEVKDIISGGPYFENGYLKLNDVPGLGVDIDEDLAAKYPYQRHYLPIPRREDGSVHGY
jgi:mannonate dehydratase